MKLNLRLAIESAVDQNYVPKIINWDRRRVQFIQSFFSNEYKAPLLLIAADLIFLNVAYQITRLVYKSLSASERLGDNKKKIKNVFILSLYALTYSSMHFIFIRCTQINVNIKLAHSTALAVFTLTNVYKWHKKLEMPKI